MDRLLTFEGQQYLLPESARFCTEGSNVVIKFGLGGIGATLQLESLSSGTEPSTANRPDHRDESCGFEMPVAGENLVGVTNATRRSSCAVAPLTACCKFAKGIRG